MNAKEAKKLSDESQLRTVDKKLIDNIFQKIRMAALKGTYCADIGYYYENEMVITDLLVKQGYAVSSYRVSINLKQLTVSW